MGAWLPGPRLEKACFAQQGQQSDPFRGEQRLNGDPPSMLFLDELLHYGVVPHIRYILACALHRLRLLHLGPAARNTSFWCGPSMCWLHLLDGLRHLVNRFVTYSATHYKTKLLSPRNASS